MKKVTLWYCWKDEWGEYVYNHLDEGWVEDDRPKPSKPEFKEQAKAFKNGPWKKEHRYLNSNKEIVGG